MAMGINYSNYRGKSSGRGHYAMTHNWDLLVSGVPGPLVTFSEMIGVEGVINASCIQVNNLPNSNLNEGILTGNVRGIPFHQAAGRESSVREINFALYDTNDYALFRFFECWKSMAVNRFDWAQNLSAMIPNGVQVIMTETDRKKVKLVYDLYDVVCTKCSLAEQLGSEPELIKTNVSLKCGYYVISQRDDLKFPSKGEATEEVISK